MSFCNPESLEDMHADAPVVARPSATTNPEPPARPTLPETASTGTDYAGSLKSAEEQLARAQAALDKALEDERKDQVYGGAADVARAAVNLGSDIQSSVNESLAWIPPLKAAYDKALNDGKYSGYAASTDYSSFVTPSLDIYNRLYKQRLALEDIEGALTAAYDMAGNVGEKYLGMKPEDVAELRKFRSEKLQPLLNNLRGFRDFGGSVDVFQSGSELVDGCDRWLGSDSDIVNQMKRLRSFIGNLNATVEMASEMLKYAADLLQASQTIMMAACTLLHAMKQFIENIGWMLLNLPFLLATLLANLIPTRQLWFKLPDSLSLLLTRVDGLRARLAGFDEVGRCYESLFLNSGDLTAGDTPNAAPKQIAPESVSGAVADFMAKVSVMATESMTAGVSKLLVLLPKALVIPNPLDPARAAWETKMGLSGMPTPRPVVLPEEGALLSFLSGAGMVVGFAGSLFSSFLNPGAAPVEETDMYIHGVTENGQATDTPLVPHPVNTIKNTIKAARQGLSNAKHAFAQAESLMRSAEAAKASARARSEAEFKTALALWTAELQAGIAGANLAVDENLSKPAQVTLNKLACRAVSKRNVNGRIIPTEAEIEAEAASLSSAPDAQHNSLVAIAGDNAPALPGQAVSAASVIAGLPRSAFPTDHTSDVGHQSLLAGYLSPDRGQDMENLPILLLLKNADERTSLRELQYIAGKLAAIDSDPKLGEAHRTLLTKAVQQGRNSNSPYTWLARGLSKTSGYETVMEMVKHFLRHDKQANVLPFASWLAEARTVDLEDPIPTGLTELEAAAAQESFYYLQIRAIGATTASEVLLLLRLRADELGQDLGYEYVVGIALLMALTRLKTALLTDATEAQITEMAQAARDLADFMTHSGMFTAMLDGLLAE